MDTIVLGGGCFWCLEAIYQQVRGVSSVISGYAGGDTENPTYENHGLHAEVVKLTYDTSQVTLKTILEIFFAVHDPTTLNRQGHDVGTQYRSIILCAAPELPRVMQAKEAAQALWQNPIVTEINVLDTFWPAEAYHQDYFNKNPEKAYCQVVINPKLKKFKEKFQKIITD